MKNSTGRKVGIVMMAVGAATFLSMMAVGIYVAQHGGLLEVQYICATGVRPAMTAESNYGNGTHTIDIVGCVWIKNEDYPHIYIKSNEINSLTCDELLGELSSGRLYYGNENRAHGKYKMSLCDYVDKLER